MKKYPVEPLMADILEDNLKKYYPNEENIVGFKIEELNRLITDYGIYICCDKPNDMKLLEKNNNRLIELLLKLCLSLSSKPIMYEDEYNYMKKYWYPDWEICNNCPKRFTIWCDKNKCNPMDI